MWENHEGQISMNAFTCPRCGSSELREQPTGSIGCPVCVSLFRIDRGKLVPLLAGMPGGSSRRGSGHAGQRRRSATAGHGRRVNLKIF